MRYTNGPDFENFGGNKDKFEIYKKHWRIEKLSPIIEYIPELQEEYNSLVEKYGKSGLSEFPNYYKSSFQVTYLSDLTKDMTIDQVIEFLKSYQIREDIFLDEDETGRIFKEFVEKNPEEYSKHATKLLKCHGLFHFKFLDGLAKIKDKELDWNEIITFLESVIIKAPNEIKILDRILNYCGGLLENNMIHSNTGIPFSFRSRVWKILEKAIEISPPDIPRFKNYSDHGWSAFGISINSSIGRIGHALIQYAVWCYYGLKTSEFIPTELVPEVKSLLDSLLNFEQEQSISIHAVLGYHFYNLLALDKEWTKSKINLIFTHDEPHTKVGNAAWDAYMFQQIYQESFYALFHEYIYRIKYSSKRIDSSSNDPQKNLAQHVGLVYTYNFEKSDELLKTFLKKADRQLLKDCIECIGKTLEKWEEKNPKKMDVSKFLSYPKIQTNPHAGWLFLNPLMSKPERISILNSILNKTKGEISPLYLILKELEKFSTDYPLETIECVEKIIKYYQNSEKIYHMTRYLEKIFHMILETKHESAIEKVNQIIHFLGSLGYEEFRKFLD